MRFYAFAIAALVLTGCSDNRPVLESPSSTLTSAKTVENLAGCISSAFMTRSMMVSGADIQNGRSVLVTNAGVMQIRVDITRMSQGSRAVFSGNVLHSDGYATLVRGCL